MNVTEETNSSILLMGGSGSSLPANYASSKSLNFAKDSATIQNAKTERVTAIPRLIDYKDTVGLFGTENVFLKIDLEVVSSASAFSNIQTPENDYFNVWTFPESGTTNDYDTAIFNFAEDTSIVNAYEPARTSNDLSQFKKPYVSVKLTNFKTGNRFLDAYFDVRLYTKNREEFAYDEMFIGAKDYFYLGFHARNTKRIPYNVRLEIGDKYIEYYDLTTAQRKLAV